MANALTSAAQPIEHQIRIIRSQKVMLDADLAALYGVSTRAFNQAVRRNLDRFPPDFMFQLSKQEASVLRSQTVTLEKGRGRFSKYAPLVFTEHGVAMLSAVLHSPRAAHTSVMIVRAFVRLREMIAANKEIANRVEKLEAGQQQTASIIEVLVNEIESIAGDLKELKSPPPSPPSRKIGFRP